jgi:hypothetical protein
MVTSSDAAKQGGFVTVQRKTVLLPCVKPVNVEVAEFNDVNVPVPDTIDQVPVPSPGAVAAKVVVVAQIFWSTPAFAVEEPEIVIVKSSVDDTQGAFAIVHLNTTEPTDKPVNVDVGDEELLIVAVPEIILHEPVPTTGVLAASVVDVPQIV